MLGVLIDSSVVVVVLGLLASGSALQRAPIPPPFRWVVDVVLAIIAIVVLLQFVWPGLRGLGSP